MSDGPRPLVAVSGVDREIVITDEEIALGEDAWRGFDDPFGTTHTDPCDELAPGAPAENTRGDQA